MAPAANECSQAFGLRAILTQRPEHPFRTYAHTYHRALGEAGSVFNYIALLLPSCNGGTHLMFLFLKPFTRWNDVDSSSEICTLCHVDDVLEAHQSGASLSWYLGLSNRKPRRVLPRELLGALGGL